MLPPDLAVSITVEGESLLLPSRPATSLALVINELVHNALKHAFHGRSKGAIQIQISRTPEGMLVEVRDDGSGFAQENARANLGMEIVNTLVRDDLCGKIEFQSDPGGTRAEVRIPRAVVFGEAE
jgi:two-component sensor histidine kinase